MKWFNRSVFLLKKLYPKRVWSIKTSSKVIYLTFDDGPIPEVTPWVLKMLTKYNAKATFFCIGENVEKNRGIFNQVKANGHSIGNHTYNHLNSKKNNTKNYLNNIKLFEDLKLKTNLFRPPYGNCKTSEARQLLNRGYKIIMWSVISEDYDKDVNPQQCLQTVTSLSKAGSIIVFHDSLKAEKNLRYTLPKVLEYYSKKGFTFKALPVNAAALKR
ncbi:polysaccharide deacetylase family protein [Mesonia aestuariivivens]|uniref:Polysaccharide deacetylase family protein n=1 Tax=Mesonia aestuariivivens TaxID=2796128 RepID=A0ABS6W1X5_9FLAO|nr:polysaccharide deacetylase family protein [Mesonia aestuariivivens]MBW2961850.1 polysaccharide deacetylase family protein [Mesonia aestuariivivens]